MPSASSPLCVVLWLSLLLGPAHASTGGQAQGNAFQRPKPNILIITTDQQRFDAIRRVQDELSSYDGKLKIRTPNLDRLSNEGAYVRTAYTQCPVCGPARVSLRTGCTIERSGVQSNDQADDVELDLINPQLFQDKINQLEGLDQILVEDHGYLSEYYGKWHMPERLYHSRDGSSRAVTYNDYKYSQAAFDFRPVSWDRMLKSYLSHFATNGYFNKIFEPGQQEDPYSTYPYTPISLDSRFGLLTNTSLDHFSKFDDSQDSQMGNYTLGQDYSASFLNHDVALRALNRLALQEKPFMLTVSYHHPHPPFMAPFEYLSYYWDQRHMLFTSPNVDIQLDDSTSYYTPREQERLKDAGYCNADNVKEWTAVYYALVEEIDTLVGIMLDRLDELGIADNTLVVFTSDHGEMLGAHCTRGKNTFFEESARVPLFVKLPGVIPAETIVEEPVSLMDVFSTILDYAGASESDKSDGSSFRPFIEGTSNNDLFDETAVVSEWDFRDPIDNVTLSRTLDDRPNFMVRHGNFKLLMHKKADSPKPDVLYNLAEDPFEMNNLINPKGPAPADAVIGKAEHLRYLLIDWMQRMQQSTNNSFYSDPIYNANEGSGDINEITNRQSWRPSVIWVSDQVLVFRKAFLVGSNYVRNEWLYIGCRTPGSLITSFRILGNDAANFRLNAGAVEVSYLGVFRLQVTLDHDTSIPQLSGPIDAYIEIGHSSGAPIYVPLLVDVAVVNTGTAQPTPRPTGAPVTPTPWPTFAPTTHLLLQAAVETVQTTPQPTTTSGASPPVVMASLFVPLLSWLLHVSAT
jgi:arylsulfatase A-like enzyme